MITAFNDQVLIEKIHQLPYNLQVETLKYIDYLIYTSKTSKKHDKKSDIFDKYFGIAENFWGIGAQEYINQLRDEDRF